MIVRGREHAMLGVRNERRWGKGKGGDGNEEETSLFPILSCPISLTDLRLNEQYELTEI